MKYEQRLVYTEQLTSKKWIKFTHLHYLLFMFFPQGGFIAPHVREIVARKKFTIFKSCHYF